MNDDVLIVKELGLNHSLRIDYSTSQNCHSLQRVSHLSASYTDCVGRYITDSRVISCCLYMSYVTPHAQCLRRARCL